MQRSEIIQGWFSLVVRCGKNEIMTVDFGPGFWMWPGEGGSNVAFTQFGDVRVGDRAFHHILGVLLGVIIALESS